MVEAPSLQSIKDRLSRELPRQIILNKREPVHTIGLMTTFDMNSPVRYQTVRVEETRDSKLVGVLICHPKAPIAKSEIVDQLAYFNERSGEAVDFFCAGYGAYWPPEHFSDQKIVATIQGVDWLFSEKAFSQVIDELESETSWAHSGETELILLTARKTKSGTTEFDFKNAIVCNLEAMAQAKAFTSVRAFFTGIFRYARTHSDSDATWGLSDTAGVKLGKDALKEAVCW
jgi:hypothetical protein